MLRDKLKEIVELVALVPERFQERCFEMLLKEAIEGHKPAQDPDKGTAQTTPKGGASKKDPAAKPEDPDPLDPEKKLENKVTGQGDIAFVDLHMKARRFLEKNGISIEKLNDLFYKENGEILPLVEDYGTTKVSETQIRIAMFQALLAGLKEGEFATTVESVRTECKDRKSYDPNNFSAIFKNKAGLFDFGTFTKETTDLRLSEDGKKELAAFIKTLK
jgi:hypothetical protein